MSLNVRTLVASVALALSAQVALAADTYTQTRYPIVLVHGMSGFDAIGPIDYFFNVPASLRASGAVVYTPMVSPFSTSEERGEQLRATLRQLKAAYGHQKFNLIGHSHGGTTARYVAAVEPSLVASVTSIGTPHQGSKVADVVKGVTGATGTTPLVASIVNALGATIAWIAGSPTLPQNALGTLESLNTVGAADFNRRFPQGSPTSTCGTGPEVVNGVRYYSAGGISVWTNLFDLSDGFLLAASVVFLGEANDGVVSRCSSRWGTVLSDTYPWNHMDEVNQAFGLRGWFTPDPVQFYRVQANRLKNTGL
ncbi:MAG: triacylglycerol lipase [Ideonella sp.]|nr:triacylglycerol lipase [Ideonella sp.]